MKRRHSFEPSKTCKRFIQMATGSWKQREVGVKNMRRKTRADLRLHEKATILEIGEKGGKAAGEGKTALLLKDRDIKARNTVFGTRKSPA